MGKLAVAPIKLVAKVPDVPGEYVADRRMTFEEYLELDHEFGLAEWIDGEVHFYVGATAAHQRLIYLLSVLFGAYLRASGGGEVFTAGLVVRVTPGGRGREPDVAVVLPEHLNRVTDTYIDGPPDIVVEIVSDESVERDQVRKRQEYERGGVPEYWIIDPRPGFQQATFLLLRDGRYEGAATLDGVFRSGVLPGFWMKLAWLWETKTSPLDRADEMVGERMP